MPREPRTHQAFARKRSRQDALACRSNTSPMPHAGASRSFIQATARSIISCGIPGSAYEYRSRFARLKFATGMRPAALSRLGFILVLHSMAWRPDDVRIPDHPT